MEATQAEYNYEQMLDILRQQCLDNLVNDSGESSILSEELLAKDGLNSQIKLEKGKRVRHLTEEQKKKKVELHRIWRANLPEEKRIKLAEDDRKRSANLTPEQRMRKLENQRIRRRKLAEQKAKFMEENDGQTSENYYQRNPNITDEQKQRKAEVRRAWLASLSEERRLIMAENRRKRRANYSEEQKKRKAEVHRIWLANLSEEKRKQMAENDRKRRANLTKEQRRRKSEKERIRVTNIRNQARLNGENILKVVSSDNSNITDEQKQIKAEVRQAWLNNLSEEKRLMMAENRRKRRANYSEEQKKRRTEVHHIWLANLSEEKRKQMADNDRKRCANLTKEQRRRKSEKERIRVTNIRNARLKEDNFTTQLAENNSEDRTMTDLCIKQEKNKLKIHDKSRLNQDKQNADHICKWRAILSETHFKKWLKWFNGDNPLKNLIKQVIQKTIDVNTIDGLDRKLFSKILDMLTIHYPRKIMLQNDVTRETLSYRIDVDCLIKLLKMWNGWSNYDDHTKLSLIIAYEDMYSYLYNNFKNIYPLKYNSLERELNEYFISENYVSVYCSLQKLQGLFYHSPHNYKKYFREDDHTSASSIQLQSSYPRYIFNWPYITTHLSYRNFSIIHSNDNIDEFHLVNITNNLKINSVHSRCKKSVIKISGDENLSYSADSIIKFLNKITDTIREYDSLENSVELLNIIKELEKDINSCTDTIKTNSVYSINSNPYPYVRYLGYPDDGNMHISINDQKSMKNSLFNIRLRQITRPKISLILERFDVNDDFVFDQSCIRNLCKSINYKCTLCDENLGSYSTSEKISDHLLKYHGFEPEWECTNCEKVFDTNYLSTHRWRHNCN